MEAGGYGSVILFLEESRNEGVGVQGLLAFPEILTSESSLYSLAWHIVLCSVCPTFLTMATVPCTQLSWLPQPLTPNALPTRSSYDEP